MPSMPKKASPPISEDSITFKKSQFYSVLVVLAFAAGVLVGFVAWGRSPATIVVAPTAAAPATLTPIPFTPTPDPAALQKLMDNALEATRHFKGDEDAPIVMIEFADFQCPFCGRHFQQTEPQIDEQYIQSGKVRFGYAHLAFLGQESLWAAEASECASDQEKFWEYHDMLYNNQAGENQGAFSKENLKQFAVELGLDTAVFNECLDSGKYSQQVQEDSNAVQALGFRSTPSFVINGNTIIGAQPFSAFEQVVESLLPE